MTDERLKTIKDAASAAFMVIPGVHLVATDGYSLLVAADSTEAMAKIPNTFDGVPVQKVVKPRPASATHDKEAGRG